MAQLRTLLKASACLPRSYSITHLNQASSTVSNSWRTRFHALGRAAPPGPDGVGSNVTQPAPWNQTSTHECASPWRTAT